MQAVHLSPFLTVFRNVEYFRKFFAVKYQMQNGDIVELARLAVKYGPWFVCFRRNVEKIAIHCRRYYSDLMII
jgi:hypothetical protein